MDRRGFLGAIAALAAAPFLGIAKAAKPKGNSTTLSKKEWLELDAEIIASVRRRMKMYHGPYALYVNPKLLKVYPELDWSTQRPLLSIR